MMNNSGAIYVEYPDSRAVVAEIRRYMLAHGYNEANYAPGDMGSQIMIPDKRRRLFFVIPPHNNFITIWEDPRYFADRFLAQHLARTLMTHAVWIEVSGNGVGWARGVYAGAITLEEYFEEMATTFYGHYGIIHFAFDMDKTPEELIDLLALPYPDLHYEAVLAHALPPDVGTPLHLSFERSRSSGESDSTGPQSETERHAI